MNKTLKIFSTLALVSATAYAGNEAKNLDKVIDEAIYLETTTPQVHLSGYVDAGYIYNFTGTSGPATTGYSTDGAGSGDFSLNAFKLVLEKALSDKNEFQAGFRADLMLGEDAAGLGANGTEGSSDSLYLQQAHVIIRAPIGHGLDIQVGKINSILGFEADERPANMNITQGVNAAPDPGPSSGIVANYPITDHVTLIGGVINGNGQDTNMGLDGSSDGYAFTGGLGVTNEGGNAETQIAFHYAPFGDGGTGQTDDENLLGLNWWGAWSPKFANDKLLLALNASYWVGNNFSAPAPAAADDSTNLYVVAAYAKYQFNSLFSLAARGEYLHSDDNQFLALPVRPVGFSNDVYTWTLTAGLNLTEELLFRAEYRLDLGSDVISNGTGTLSGDAAHGLAAQIVYSF